MECEVVFHIRSIRQGEFVNVGVVSEFVGFEVIHAGWYGEVVESSYISKCGYEWFEVWESGHSSEVNRPLLVVEYVAMQGSISRAG